MNRLTMILELCSVFAFSLTVQGSTIEPQVISEEANLTNTATPELFKQLTALEVQHIHAPTTQEKDALNEKQLRVYQELVRRGEIF